MKICLKIFFLSVFVVAFAKVSFADEYKYNFRKTTWGMSKDQVKSTEPLKVAKEDTNLLGYKTTVIGKDVLVIYIFVDNQLVRTKYALVESHSNKNDFITDYNGFKEILTKKYGDPKQDKTVWRKDLYKDDYARWGTAISRGDLIYLSSWDTNNTEIVTVLSGENYKISCIVEYSSKNLKEIEEKAKEKKALDAF